MISRRAVHAILYLLLSSVYSISKADTGIANNSYSSFGIGIQVFTYTEDFSGAKFDVVSTSSPLSVVQYSGGYTALDETDGFYITTTSPLFNISANEAWGISGILPTGSSSITSYPSVQANQTELGLSILNLSLSRIFSPGHQGLVGVRYSTHNFTRYEFTPGADAEEFNNWLISQNSDVPAYADGVAFDIPGCTNNINPPVVGMECTSVALQEQVTSLSLSIGYKYDTIFVKGYRGPRFIVATSIAIPAFYMITNTLHPGASLIGSFGEGYDASVKTSLAVFERKDFQLNLGLETALMHRNQVIQTSTNLSYPSSDTVSFSTYMSFDWSFD